MTDVDEACQPEEQEWALLSVGERFRQYSRLFEFYLAAGGSLAPERDSQSPFDFEEYYGASASQP